MSPWTAVWQAVAPALLVAGLIAAPVGLDLQQGLWASSEVYARGSGPGGAGEAGPGHSRGDGLGGRGGAGESAASAAGSDARESKSAASATGSGAGAGRGGAGNPRFENFRHQGAFAEVRPETAREQALTVARERYNRALSAPAQISAKASVGPGQKYDTAKAVFVFGEKTTEALIQAGWVAPQVRSDRALADHGQKVTTYVAIATALGYPAHVGVLLATLGSDGPGRGPAGDWQDVDLDLNGDGVVDEQDLELAWQRQVAR
jgi:hypothetical protein